MLFASEPVFCLFADDHQTLETELRAPNNLALENERTLIGTFDDDRLTIERPMTFEPGGFRYVDAEGFLDWLSQYIAQSQTKITFPNELASEVRKTKAKAAASQPTVASQKFASMTLAFDDWFDKDLDDLPIHLRQCVEREFSPMPWDNLSAAQRRSVALQFDYQHDPATEQDRKFWWDFFVRMGERKEQIAEWKSAATPTISDISLKESRLKELQQEIDRMELQQRQARGDYYPERKSLDADKVSSQTITDYIAYPKAMKILREMDGDAGRTGGMDFHGARHRRYRGLSKRQRTEPAPAVLFRLLHGRGLSVATHGLLVSAGRS
jgi:hypothetical protein